MQYKCNNIIGQWPLLGKVQGHSRVVIWWNLSSRHNCGKLSLLSFTNGRPTLSGLLEAGWLLCSGHGYKQSATLSRWRWRHYSFHHCPGKRTDPEFILLSRARQLFWWYVATYLDAGAKWALKLYRMWATLPFKRYSWRWLALCI